MLGPGTNYRYLYTASREPVPGAAVRAVESFTTGEDTYLLWHPQTLTDREELPNSMTVLSQAQNTALVQMRRGKFPFFEHRVWYTLRDHQGDAVRIYSLTDARQFLQALPWISGIAAVLLICMILWAAAFALPKGTKLVWLNAGLIAGALCTLPWLTSQFDLPASLMPAESILQVSHYTKTFERIFSSLQTLGSTMLQQDRTDACTASAAVLAGSLLMVTLVIVLEALWYRKRRKKDSSVHE